MVPEPSSSYLSPGPLPKAMTLSLCTTSPLLVLLSQECWQVLVAPLGLRSSSPSFLTICLCVTFLCVLVLLCLGLIIIRPPEAACLLRSSGFVETDEEHGDSTNTQAGSHGSSLVKTVPPWVEMMQCLLFFSKQESSLQVLKED